METDDKPIALPLPIPTRRVSPHKANSRRAAAGQGGKRKAARKQAAASRRKNR